MSQSIEKLWSKFCSDYVHKKFSFQLRKGSNFKRAEPWVVGRASPAQPVKMLSVREVYEGWANPSGVKLARERLRLDPTLTMRELGYLMLKSDQELPYIWWCFSSAPKQRAIYEDSEGLNFVKLDNKWQMAYSIMSAGILIGSQSGKHYEDLPKNSYMVLWENEEMARQHAI